MYLFHSIICAHPPSLPPCAKIACEATEEEDDEEEEAEEGII